MMRRDSMRSESLAIGACRIPFRLSIAVVAWALIVPLHAQSTPSAPSSSAPAQEAFQTPQQAADALIQAAGSFDVAALEEIFGPAGKDLFASADSVQDKNRAEAFAAKAREKTQV